MPPILRNIRWRSHFFTLLLFVALVFALNAWRTREVPLQAPDLAGTLADGTPVTLAQFRAQHPGRAIALHFWADWCPVCRSEQPAISRLVADPDTPVLTVAMQSGDAAAVRRVLAERGLAWPTLVDEDGTLSRSWGLPAVPAFVVIDPQGRITSAQVGFTTETGMRARLWLAGRTPAAGGG